MFITTKQLAELANINPRNARIAASLGNWRGCKLNVREVDSAGGRGGKSYEICVDSLPHSLKAKWYQQKQAEIKQEPPEKKVVKVKKQMNPEATTQTAQPSYCKHTLWAIWERATTAKCAKAEEKLNILQAVESLIAEGMTKNDAILQIVGVSKRASVYRWYTQIEGVQPSDWLAALLPSNNGRTGIAPAYDEELFQAYKTYYLSTARRTSEHCYALAVEEFRKQNPDAVVPHEITLRRRLRAEVDQQVLDYCRNGKNSKLFQNPVPPQRRDKKQMWAMQTINGDGYDHKFYVVFPDGEEAKPTTWFWQDIYSGMILGWYSDKSENSDMLRLALKEVLTEYGLGVDSTPFTIIVDNTRAASAKVLTGRMRQRHRYKVREDEIMGVFGRLNTPYQPTLPYSGQSKPIERKFGIGGVSHYVDKNPLVDDARNKGKGISWESFQNILVAEVQRMNNRISTSDVCAGVRSPKQVFEDSWQKHIPLVATPQQLNMLLMCAQGVPVAQHGGINFMNNGYYNQLLSAYGGKRVMIEYDPYRLRDGLNVYTLDGRHICQAECTAAVGFHDTSAAREQMKLKRRQQKLIKAAAAVEQQEGALRRRQRLQEQPKPEPVQKQKVVGLNFNAKPKPNNNKEREERDQRLVERMKKLEAMNKRAI